MSALDPITLEILWRRWGGQEGMPAPAEAERSAHEALDDLVKRLPPGVRLGRRELLALERERLSRRIGQLLEHDRSRPPFTVEACEEERDIRVGPLSLQLRIDRIDRHIDTGVWTIFDYKTSDSARSPAMSTAWMVQSARTNSSSMSVSRPGRKRSLAWRSRSR